jgi:hypothetical protein
VRLLFVVLVTVSLSLEPSEVIALLRISSLRNIRLGLRPPALLGLLQVHFHCLRIEVFLMSQKPAFPRGLFCQRKHVF